MRMEERLEADNGPDGDLARMVFERLGEVMDPELGGSITELGMVRGVRIEHGEITVEIALTIAGCPMRATIQNEVRARVQPLAGVEKVRFEWREMNAEERALTMQRARQAVQRRAELPPVARTARVIAIASGKGGVGKSTVTANLARVLAAGGARVGVLDADVWGFSQPRMLGERGRLTAAVQHDGAARIVPASVPVGEGEVRVVSTGLLVGEETALMWRGAMLAKAVEQFLRDVEWGELDYLLIDMPPGTGDVHMRLAASVPTTETIVVTTPARAAVAVAQRAGDMAARSNLPVIGVIENMSGGAEGGSPFGEGGGAELAARLQTRLLGSIPLSAEISRAADEGTPVAEGGEAGAAFRALADEIRRAAPPLGGGSCASSLLARVERALREAPVQST